MLMSVDGMLVQGMANPTSAACMLATLPGEGHSCRKEVGSVLQRCGTFSRIKGLSLLRTETQTAFRLIGEMHCNLVSWVCRLEDG